MKNFAKTAQESEEGISPGSLEKDLKVKKNKSTRRHPKIVERRYPDFTENIYQYFIEYSNYTTIQGIRYMGEQSRSIFERLVWLIIFCVSLYLCTNQILESYNKWETSPVLVSFDTSPTPLWKIPFPAITICSSVKARRSEYQFSDHHVRKFYRSESERIEAKKQLNSVSLICRNMFKHAYFYDDDTTEYYETIEFLIKIAPTFKDTMEMCRVLRWDCRSSFTPILTEEGICYTFNMLNRSEIFKDNVLHYGDLMSNEQQSEGWTLGAGYKKNTSLKTYPERATLTLQDTLQIELKADKEDTHDLCMDDNGFKVVLHNPGETPNVASNYFYAPFGQIVQVAIKPEMMTTSDGLKRYDPHRRQCYFPEERHLAFYRSYTQANCEMECLANLTRKFCECVPLHMPHEEGWPTCGMAKKDCILSVKQFIVENDMELLVEGKESDQNGTLLCDCLPGCTSLEYNADISQVDITTLYASTAIKTILNINFKDRQFIASTKNELHSGTDFLASCGGLLGLFTGFSFLSFVEILYFLSLRLFCNIKRYGRHYWSGSQQLVNNEKYDHKN